MKVAIRFLFLLVTLSFVFSKHLPFRSRPKSNPFIIGGEEIDISERPFQVVLRHYGSFQCGGSILSANWILTAGHCLDMGIPAEYVSVRAGSKSVGQGGQVVRALNYTLHPEYDKRWLFNDVAIVYLEEALEFGPNVAPIHVIQNEVPVGSIVDVSGWGLTENNTYPEMLRSVRLEIIENGDCSEQLEEDITADMVCAVAPQKDSCNGDSGGPLTYKNSNGCIYQAGIVSWGPIGPCGLKPGVYTRLSHPKVREFIRRETRL